MNYDQCSKYGCISTKSVNDYWNESQSVNIVPISKYSLNATMFHYGLAIPYLVYDKSAQLAFSEIIPKLEHLHVV